MTNHIHLIAVPKTEDGLRRAIGEAHRRYTRHIYFQKGWKGHLWQRRFCDRSGKVDVPDSQKEETRSKDKVIKYGVPRIVQYSKYTI
jgi:REP element-mobilizing transposase RayT